jgi:hypothetical protein
MHGKTDEELIQMLEDLTSSPETPWEAILPLIEELDRRHPGQAPFDPQRGWADLQSGRRKDPPIRALGKYPPWCVS